VSDPGAINLDEMRAIDPSTPAGELAAIAYRSPGLRATVAAHPNAYDDLRTWIAEFGADPVTPVRPAESAEGLDPVEEADAVDDVDAVEEAEDVDDIAETVTARPSGGQGERSAEPVVQTIQRQAPAPLAAPEPAAPQPPRAVRPPAAPPTPRPPRPPKAPRVRNPDPSPVGDAAAAISAAWKRLRRDGEGRP
jgi:hypothetical protein